MRWWLARGSLPALALAGALAAAPAFALDDLNWLAPGSDRAAVLTTAPAECIGTPAGPKQAWLVSLGRVAFRSPALLGGLAARSGVSCDTCHRNGHGNPDFFIAGVSGVPGTADVTSAIFSQTRGDGTANPVPIPDLTGIAGKASFGTVRPAGDLHGFVHSVMVEEFQGTEPAPAVARALVAYVSALDGAACPAGGTEATDFPHAAAGLLATYAVLLGALDRGEVQVTDFVLRSLNLEMGRIAQRFPGSREARETLPVLGRDLAAIRPLLRDDPDGAHRALSAWRTRLDGVLEALSARQGDSLFDRRAVERFLTSR
ncbi:MAG: hypothetical protein AB7O49_18445 [Sphingomonadales bacterium]